MDHKGAIGLALETIVIVIISIVILASGIVVLKSFITGAEGIKSTLDERTEQQIERLLTEEGKPVVLPISSVTLNPGDHKIIGIGILNINSQKYGYEFKITHSLNKAVDTLDADITERITNSNEWLLYNSEALKIQENQAIKEPILIQIPKDAQKGTYFFKILILDGNNKQYYYPQRLQITIK